MENIVQEELRNKLEIVSLMNFVKWLDEPVQNTSHVVWIYRYFYFLKCMLDEKEMPEGINLEHIVDFTFTHKAEKLKEYLSILPGMNYPIVKNERINPNAIENHAWIVMMVDGYFKEYENKINRNSCCYLTFKESNCFTFLSKDNYIHIQSNSLNILDYDWTIVSVESINGIDVKKINFKNINHISYYIKNYNDFSLLSGKEVNDIIEMIMF